MLRQIVANYGAVSVFLGAAGVVASSVFVDATHAHADAAHPPALNPNEWRSFKVVKKHQVNHNTVWLRFGLPDPQQDIGLNVASCLIVRAPIGSQHEDGSTGYVIRPYTPVSERTEKGHFDLMVKVYPQGLMSKHLGELKEGEALEVKGPIGKLPYHPNMKKRLGMIAGGSGLTPMLQVVQEILKNPQDKTEVSLIFANQTPKDILLKETLDKMAKEHSNFKVHYMVDKADYMGLFWKGGVGYITEDVVRGHLPPPGDDNMILVCGPPPMMNAISGDKAPDKTQGELSGVLAKMGYTKDQVYKF